jgi:NAD(P)H-hydrate epimerase
VTALAHHSPEPPPLPRRDPAGHKGTFGTVVVIGACCHHQPDDDHTTHPSMLGGACFTAVAALRAGCGLAKLLIPDPLVPAALTIAPSATAFAIPVDHTTGDIIPHRAASVIDHACRTASAAVIGPGLGISRGAIAATLRLLAQPELPVIADADAISCMAEVEDIAPDINAPLILTPHPGEFARIAKSLGLSADLSSPTARTAAVEHLARRLGSVVVLKSDTTIVSDGHATWTHHRPNPVLATAGSGDVLAGILAALIAQHVRPHIPLGSFTKASQHQGGLSLYDAARLAVAIHADAAALWHADTGASGGMLALELADRIPRAVEARRA